MTQRAVAILLAAFLLVSLSGRGASKFVTYRNGEKRFSIDFPENWEQQEGVMGTAVAAVRPQKPGDFFRENVNVVVEDLSVSMDADEYLKANLATMRKYLTDFKVHQKGNMTLDGRASRWIVYGHRMGQLKLKVLAVFLMNDQRGYVITSTSTPQRFSSYRKLFEKIAGTFRLEQGTGAP